MLKMSHADCPGQFSAILVQFTPKMCDTARNRKKSLKTPILKVQGHSRLLKVIDVDTNRNLATIGC